MNMTNTSTKFPKWVEKEMAKREKERKEAEALNDQLLKEIAELLGPNTELPIGDIFEFNGNLFEVTETTPPDKMQDEEKVTYYEKPACEFCGFNNNSKVCMKMKCAFTQRQDGKEVYYKEV